MTFAELTTNCTNEERRDLAWFLAMLRMRRTLEALLPDRPE